MTCRRPLSSPRSFSLAACVLALLALGAPVAVRAQSPGELDPVFRLTEDRAFIPLQNNFTPFALAVQPQANGTRRLLIAGDQAVFVRVYLEAFQLPGSDAGGAFVTRTAAPGGSDQSFLASPNTDNGFGNAGRIIYSLAVQADGKILVGGLFGRSANSRSFFNKREVNFARLSPDGLTENRGNETGDPADALTPSTFNGNVGEGANDSVLAILETAGDLGSPARILLGGQFTRFNKLNRNRIVGLLPTGAADEAFNNNLGAGANGIVFSLARDTRIVPLGVDSLGFPFSGRSGQVYVCGDFDRFNNQSFGKLVRLNADGTLDATFNPKISGRAIAVAVQEDGKVLVGGDLDSVNGQGVDNLARLNADGTLDSTFQGAINISSPRNIPPTAVYVIRVQVDGRIVVGGNFQRANGEQRPYIARFFADGTLDPSFNADQTRGNNDPLQPPNQATQAIAFAPAVFTAPDFTATGAGYQSILRAQTRSDKKVVSGDNGFYQYPVTRTFDDLFLPSIGVQAGVQDGAGPFIPQTDLTAAGTPTIQEGNPRKGIFLITRSGEDLSRPRTVFYTLSGTAINGQDFKAVSGQVVIPAGQTSARVKIKVKAFPNVFQTDENPLQFRFVTLTLSEFGSGGDLALSPANATLVINSFLLSQ